MIAVDTNILIYAHRGEMPFHSPASACVTELAEGAAPWLLPWPCIHEFLSVVTNPRTFKTPTTLEAAIRQVGFWMASPSLVMHSESDKHWATLSTVATRARIAGGAIHDARIAAICLDHEVSALWTADRDFSRFAGLNVVNPLVQA